MLTQAAFKDSYALVTGSSDGLGREFATQLATQGMNLVLVARHETKLNETAQALRAASGRQVVVIAADLTKLSDLESVHRTLQQKSIRIRVLVNNAGAGAWGPFEKSSLETYSQMMDLNAKAPVLLSKMFFDDLCSFESSAIINVASLAAIQPIPYMSVYAASKSALAHFSLALWSEWENKGIYVQTLMPGAMDTKFDEKAGGFKAPFKKDNVQTIVELSLRDLFGPRKAIVYARGSILQRLFAKVLPLRFLIREVAKVFLPK